MSVSITILLFGACREVAGVDELKFDLTAPAVAADAWLELKKLYPSLETFERSALVAINEEHARMGDPLKDGDILAIFPPVSGGSCAQVSDGLWPPVSG